MMKEWKAILKNIYRCHDWSCFVPALYNIIFYLPWQVHMAKFRIFLAVVNKDQSAI